MCLGENSGSEGLSKGYTPLCLVSSPVSWRSLPTLQVGGGEDYTG